MWMVRTRILLVVGATTAVVALAMSHEGAPDSPRAPDFAPEGTGEAGFPRSATSPIAVSRVPHLLTQKTSEKEPPRRKDEPLGWDERAPEERVEHLAKRFAIAVSAIENGENDPRHISEAQDALTSMRAELNETPSGRARHRRYETRLDRALGEAAPANKGSIQ